jgi:hypothetical protein
MAHQYTLPVRDSSTEGDCLELAQAMPNTAREYVRRLVVAWQLAVYGRITPDDAAVHELCGEFATALSGAHASGGAS